MSAFRSMGVEVRCETADDGVVAALFEERDARFSRFRAGSELNAVNGDPAAVRRVTSAFAGMLRLALRAARASGGLVTPTAGATLLAAGYDRDWDELDRDDPRPPRTAALPPWRSLGLLRGDVLLRSVPVVLDLNGVVKGAAVDDALAAAGRGWVCAGGDLATTVPLPVALPDGQTIELRRGGLATSSVARRNWRRDGEFQHHLIDPRTGRPSRSPWRDVTVVAGSCAVADVAAKTALLLGTQGPRWLEHRRLAGRFLDGDGRATSTVAWRAAVAA